MYSNFFWQLAAGEAADALDRLVTILELLRPAPAIVFAPRKLGVHTAAEVGSVHAQY